MLKVVNSITAQRDRFGFTGKQAMHVMKRVLGSPGGVRLTELHEEIRQLGGGGSPELLSMVQNNFITFRLSPDGTRVPDVMVLPDSALTAYCMKVQMELAKVRRQLPMLHWDLCPFMQTLQASCLPARWHLQQPMQQQQQQHAASQ